MTVVYILAGWFALSIALAAAWSRIRSTQKAHDRQAQAIRRARGDAAFRADVEQRHGGEDR